MMEDELPPELRSRREAIYAQVTQRGRARRYRRRGAVAFAIAVVVATPIVGVALTRQTGHNERVATFAPSTTTEGDTTTLTPTTTSPTTSTVAPPTTTSTTTTTTSSPPTTTLICRNSTNPACGPLSYVPPVTNQPATLVVTTEPRAPTAGQTVTFKLHATDPDTFISSDMFCGQIMFGEGNGTGCQVACAPIGPQYGPWAPPPPRPSDVTFTVTHVYPRAGTYTARFSFVAGECSVRPSPASTSINVRIA
jgi:hypothetical protein